MATITATHAAGGAKATKGTTRTTVQGGGGRAHALRQADGRGAAAADIPSAGVTWSQP